MSSSKIRTNSSSNAGNETDGGAIEPTAKAAQTVARAKKSFGATAQALARPVTQITIPPPPVSLELQPPPLQQAPHPVITPPSAGPDQGVVSGAFSELPTLHQGAPLPQQPRSGTSSRVLSTSPAAISSSSSQSAITSDPDGEDVIMLDGDSDEDTNVQPQLLSSTKRESSYGTKENTAVKKGRFASSDGGARVASVTMPAIAVENEPTENGPEIVDLLASGSEETPQAESNRGSTDSADIMMEQAHIMLAKSLGEMLRDAEENNGVSDTGNISASGSQQNLEDDSDMQEGDTASDGRAESPSVPDLAEAQEILGPGVQLPLCQCKVRSDVKMDENPPQRCQAISSVDRDKRGCSNVLSSTHLFRSSVRVPFMALCDAHIILLKMHVCCPTCGVFCLKGEFFECNGGAHPGHVFHRGCVSVNGTCPHCDYHDFQLSQLSYFEEMAVNPFAGLRGMRDITGRAVMTLPAKTPKQLPMFEENPNIPALRVKSTGRTLNASLVGKKEDKEKMSMIFDELKKGWRPERERTLRDVIMVGPNEEIDLLSLCYVLCNKGEDPNQKLDQNNNTALHLAVEKADFLASYVLLMAGADPNLSNGHMHMPLVSACHNGKAGLAQMLLRFGADPSIKVHYEETDGSTALHIASVGGHTAVVHYLLNSKKIKINTQDDGGWTALSWATEHGQADVANLLLDRGAKPMLKDLEGNICLHWAAYSGSQQISERLLQINGARALTETNKFGDTPLHVAARQKHWTLVELFLLHGADVNKLNGNGESPTAFIKNATRHDIQLANMMRDAQQRNRDKNIAERILTTDAAKERENFPIPVVNEIDQEQPPADFQYVTSLVETQQIHVNRMVNKFRCCYCRDDCSSGQCACNGMNDFGGKGNGGCAYNEDRTLSDYYDMQVNCDTIYECNVACACVSSCRNRVAQKGIGYRFQIYKTANRGWGVKILEAVRRGTYICEYAGEILTGDEADAREDDSYLFELEVEGQNHCIDAKFYGNLSRFINHSCSPNLIPVRVLWDHQDVRFSHICFYAFRDIARDEELSFDYGDKFWIVKYRSFRCKCGSTECKYSDEKIGDFVRNYFAEKQEEEEMDRSAEGERLKESEGTEKDISPMENGI